MQQNTSQQIIGGFVAIVFGFIIWVYITIQNDKKEEAASSAARNISNDCSNAKGSYASGYASGKTSGLMGGTSSCQTYVNDYNYNTGRDILNADDCFCEGFKDGYNDKPEKYK
jgi:hypothetical protein